MSENEEKEAESLPSLSLGKSISIKSCGTPAKWEEEEEEVEEKVMPKKEAKKEKKKKKKAISFCCIEDIPEK